MAINDLADEVVDRINLIHQGQITDRPIINKTLTSRQVTVVAIVASILTIVSSAGIELWLGVLAIVMIVLNIVYSMPPIQISKRGGFAQLLLPLMYVVYPLAIVFAISHRQTLDIFFVWLTLGLYSLFAGRLFLKDIRDENGDRKVGKNTFLVRHGLKLTIIQSLIWSFVGIVFVAHAVVGKYNHLVETLLVAVVTIVGIYFTLHACYMTRHLQDKLLLVAMMGRFASMWVFYVLVLEALSYSNVKYAMQSIALLFVVALFAAGVAMLYEELGSIRRIRAKQLQSSEQ